MISILALIVFITSYIYIATEKFNWVAISLVGAAAIVIVGATDADAAIFSHDTGVMKTFADFLKDLVGSKVTLAAMSLL